MYWSYITIAVGLLVLWRSFQRSDYAFSYPTMLAGATLYFVAPGLHTADEYKLFPESTRAVASLYVAACLLCGVWGWSRPFQRLERYLASDLGFPSARPLAMYCIGAIVFSSFFAWKLRGVDTELLDQTQWSGPHVIYHFFTQPGYFTTSVAAIAFAVTRRPIFAVLALTACAMYMLPPVLRGKRDEIVEAGIIAAMCWSLVARRPIPRTFVLGAGLLLGILFSSIGIYRSVSKNEGVVQGVQQAIFSRRVNEIPPEHRYGEANNYIAVIEEVVQGRVPNFGLAYWNGIVFRYVPGQLTGHDFKQTLQFDIPIVTRDEIREKGIRSITGTTMTGFSDTIQAFSLLGPFVFYFIGCYLSAIFNRASRGSSVCMFAYSHLLVMSGVAVTHSTMHLICASLNVFMFMVIWVQYINRNFPPESLAGSES